MNINTSQEAGMKRDSSGARQCCFDNAYRWSRRGALSSNSATHTRRNAALHVRVTVGSTSWVAHQRMRGVLPDHTPTTPIAVLHGAPRMWMYRATSSGGPVRHYFNFTPSRDTYTNTIRKVRGRSATHLAHSCIARIRLNTHCKFGPRKCRRYPVRGHNVR